MSPAFAFAALALIFYIEAGRRNLQALYLTSSKEERAVEPLWQAIEANAVPWTFKLIYITTWAPISALAWIMARRARHN